MIVKAVEWAGDIDGYLEIVDQRKLPGEFVKLRCRSTEQLYEAITTLAVRGAPAGLVLAGQNLRPGQSLGQAISIIAESCDYLASSRPTAVNLRWALDRVVQKARAFAAKRPKANPLRKVLLGEADAIFQEDVDMCGRIGLSGEHLIQEGAGVLTHCNAGALATAGQGTALSVLFEAQKKGRKFKVYVDETRPLLQGARLTAWELQQAGIDVTLICDNTAGWLMKQGRISAVITGADRIAANGDTANKIGTYSLSILLSIENGQQVPIEERAADEVRFFGETRTAPEMVAVYNPAFDVTEARDISAIITERGVIELPTAERIAAHLR